MEGIIHEKLRSYKKKYYLNNLIRNSVISLTIVLLVWVVLSTIEFGLNLSPFGRTILFALLTSSAFAFLVFGIVIPLINYFGLRKQVSDERVAKEIGDFFPEIDDKLLNTIQLSKSKSAGLVAASIDKRIEEVRPIQFNKAIDLKINWKYGRWLAGLTCIIILSSLSFPKIFIDSTDRILNYKEEYVKAAPFSFNINNEELLAFRDENFELSVELTGEFIPAESFIMINGRKTKLEQKNQGQFSYTFEKPYQSMEFMLEAAGYRSQSYSLQVVNRAEVNSFEIQLAFPPHTGIDNTTLKNNGNITAPEGTISKWLISAGFSEEGKITFENSDSIALTKDDGILLGSKQLRESERYEINVSNNYGKNKELLQYKIELIPDEYPEVEVQFYLDTILFEYIIAAGRLEDDYGIRNAKVRLKNRSSQYSTPIEVQKRSRGQGFYRRIELDSLNLAGSIEMEAFVEVTDNDAINNFKTSRSQSFVFKLPSTKDIKEQLDKKSRESEKGLKESMKESKNLNEKIKEVQNRLKSKRDVDWQEERLLDEILKQRKQLEEEIEKLQNNLQQLQEGDKKFSERDEELQRKAEEIQQLMEEVLDEETKKLYEELEKLLEEKANSEEIQNLLQDLAPNELDLEKELERTLELFKRLKMETKLEDVTNDLKELAEKQNELAEETGEKSSNIDSIANEQQKINEEFEEIKKELDEVEKLNQELKNPESMQDFSSDEEEISDSLEKSQEQLENNERKQGQQQQKNSGQMMQQMSQKMEQMQAGMQMEMMQENLSNLRDIVDNLVKLSFKEEELIRGFRQVRQVDPRFVELSQEQLKLKEDAKVIQDSLLALAGRVSQISNFVTREVTEMNRNIDEALKELKNRNRSKALSNQQFAMTSINNLSLLLSDVLQQMQQAMASQSGQGKGKEKQNASIPELKELQKQLGDQIQQLKESGLQGRQLSEQLAKMAARQEMIRNQLREFEKQLKGQPGNEEAGKALGEILEEMEKNEEDLVNKRITQQLIERQKEIETRMLEAEESLKDQGFDNKRKGEKATSYEQRRPEAFEEYIKEKEKELELLKSVPLELSPFYKKELNYYFRRISSDN